MAAARVAMDRPVHGGAHDERTSGHHVDATRRQQASPAASDGDGDGDRRHVSRQREAVSTTAVAGLVGGRTRAEWLAPVLAAAEALGAIDVVAVASHSRQVSPSVRKALRRGEELRVHESAAKMISAEKQANLRLVIVSLRGKHNVGVLREILGTSYEGVVLMETELAISPQERVRLLESVRASKIDVGVEDAWAFQPLELLKQKMVASGKLVGRVTRVANEGRALCLHGSAMSRAYIGSPVDVSAIEHVKVREPSAGIKKHRRARSTDGVQIDVLHPKGGARTVRVDGTQGSLSGNCLLPPLGASGDGSGQAILGNLLTYKSKVQGRASNRPSPIQLTVHLSPGPGDVPRRIVTEEVRGTRYEWTNEFGDVTNALDQKQYGALKHVVRAASGRVLYSLAQHMLDMSFCD